MFFQIGFLTQETMGHCIVLQLDQNFHSPSSNVSMYLNPNPLSIFENFSEILLFSKYVNSIDMISLLCKLRHMHRSLLAASSKRLGLLGRLESLYRTAASFSYLALLVLYNANTPHSTMGWKDNQKASHLTKAHISPSALLNYFKPAKKPLRNK